MRWYYRQWWLVLCFVSINVNIVIILLTMAPSVTVNNHSNGLCKLSLELSDEQVRKQHVRNSKTESSRKFNSHRNYASKTNDSFDTKSRLADLMPLRLREMAFGLPVTITADEFRSEPEVVTGNPLIDSYGEPERMMGGEMGRGVIFAGKEKDEADALLNDLNLNVMASDVIPLNRMVPDPRMKGCQELSYVRSDLTVSVIVPFYEEWPSVLLRTLYSLVNRSPRANLLEIILVDDHSHMDVLGKDLEQYLHDYFPRDLVRVVRVPERVGLIRARMAGVRVSSGDVTVFVDSHVEVADGWLQPLLAEIDADHQTVAMAVLDYIDAKTFQYNYNHDFTVRYGFDWRLFFFEALPRSLPGVTLPTQPYPGVVSVGSCFAIHRQYFQDIGGYDEGMEVWGGENIELAWRVWMCGGRLVHVPCSHVGHIARAQPYKFPDGRHMTTLRNYKRAAEVWMGDYKRFLYENFPELKDFDVGDLRDRIALRDKLQCHNFTWYLDNIWPELMVYDRDVIAWGSAVNNNSRRCLDNHHFQGPLGLYTATCHFKLLTQGFSLTKDGLLRTTLQCVVVTTPVAGVRPTLEDCVTGSRDKWRHTKDRSLIHQASGLCLDEDKEGPIMTSCFKESTSQKWHFTKYVTIE